MGSSYTDLSYHDTSKPESVNFSGILRDHHTGVEFKANSGLSCEDLLTIATVAKTVYQVILYKLKWDH